MKKYHLMPYQPTKGAMFRGVHKWPDVVSEHPQEVIFEEDDGLVNYLIPLGLRGKVVNCEEYERVDVVEWYFVEEA